MKNIYSYLLLIILLSLSLIIIAQPTPETLLDRLPSVPSVACSGDTSVISRFDKQIDEVKVTLNKVIDQLQAEVQGQVGMSQSKMIADAVTRSGLNADDLKKLQQEGNEEELGSIAAEKAISEQYGLSLQDLEKLGEMSEADQEKWAQNYAGNMMGKAKTDPSAAKRNDTAEQLFELAKEQKALGDRITERMNRVALLLRNVEIQDSIESNKLDKKRQPLEEQICSGICSPAEIARSKAAEKQIYNLEIQFCDKMSPLLTDAISQYLTTLKSLFPDYRKLSEVENEIARIQQLGEFTPIDLSCYAAIDDYTDVLSIAYKYYVGKFYE